VNHITIQQILTIAGLASSVIACIVSLHIKGSAATIRADVAEMENRIVERINGTYTRKDECSLRMERVLDRVDRLEEPNGHQA